jgi:uncharacterized protein (TIGR02246 family)
MLALVSAVLALNAWAGPAEEVSQIAGPRLKALQEGNADSYTADFADNAVFYSSFSPFRIEGKEAIRAFFADLFQQYPKRRTFIRQPLVRVYGDNLVVQNGYAVLNWVDEEEDAETYNIRYSAVWVKIGGRWQIVDQHFARLPESEAD